MIIIEGPRNVGKTYMLSHIGYNSYKVRFSAMKEPYTGSNEFFHGMGVGKDIELLELNKAGLIPLDAIFDRGFLSTLVYDKILGRCSKAVISDHMRNILNNYLLPDHQKTIAIIFIFGENPEPRVKDELDDLPYEPQMHEYAAYHDLIFSDSQIVLNKYDEDSIQKLKEAIDWVITVMTSS